jgi:transposase
VRSAARGCGPRRAAVRRFLERFAGQELEVALEATTGWRFFVEELRAVGAVVHVAEPAETAARRGNKRRAKTDRMDARHHRELLLAGRLPESWIPPDHILDLRARVRLRHTLIEQHSQWQQRIQAVLYHHGCLQRRRLMEGDGPDWLSAQPLPETARQQITVALAMIDALGLQIAPLDRQLRPYARRQIGCKALIDAYYGVGELVAVTILSELGDCRRFANSRDAVRYGGMDITVYQSDRHRSPGHLSRQGPPALRWALYEAAQHARFQTAPTASTTCRPPSASVATAPAWRSRASCSSAATTRCASSAMTPWRHPPTASRVAQPRAARQATVTPKTDRPPTREPTDALAA